MLWMQHVKHMVLAWPVQKKKEHIEACPESAWMLVPNTNMVLLRRFSPKEDVRRITASAYVGGSLPGEVIGLENHLNYVHRPGGSLSTQEAIGLAAYLNSRAVDGYFRMGSGNTQVNAIELRRLPLPPQHKLNLIGALLAEGATDLDRVDAVVSEVLGLEPAQSASLNSRHA
jgi:adenine-specific DNA-methyltransferase